MWSFFLHLPNTHFFRLMKYIAKNHCRMLFSARNSQVRQHIYNMSLLHFALLFLYYCLRRKILPRSDCSLIHIYWQIWQSTCGGHGQVGQVGPCETEKGGQDTNLFHKYAALGNNALVVVAPEFAANGRNEILTLGAETIKVEHPYLSQVGIEICYSYCLIRIQAFNAVKIVIAIRKRAFLQASYIIRRWANKLQA